MAAINDDGLHPFSTSPGSDISDLFHQTYDSFGTRPRIVEPHVSLASPRPESVSSDGLVKVEITDFECNDSTNVTIGALRRCKRHIVSPFYICLKFVGWRQFGYGRVSFDTRWWNVFNVCYLVVILCLLFFNYAFTIVACNSRLTTEMDGPSMFHPTKPPPTTPIPHNVTSIPWLTFRKSLIRNLTTPSPFSKSKNLEQSTPTTCSHMFTSYIIPNILHLLAYFLGFLHFRVRKNEALDSLMEKVFLYCESTYIKHVSQKWLIGRLKSYVYFLVFWTLLAVVTHILCDVCVLQDDVPLIDDIMNPSVTTALLFLDMMGTLIVVGVSMTVLLNYVVHCELIIFYAKLVLNKLRERSLNLRVAIKDLYQINIATKRLNSTTSIITSLILLICLEKVAIGTSIILKIRFGRPIVWAYRVLFILHQIPILIFPLVQAARVNTFYGRFRRTILEIRTFGYQNAPQIELDSFVLFSKANNFRAKLFFVPIRGSFLVMGAIVVSFVFVLLVQNGYITDLPFV